MIPHLDVFNIQNISESLRQARIKIIIFKSWETRRKCTPQFFYYYKGNYNLFGFMVYLVKGLCSYEFFHFCNTAMFMFSVSFQFLYIATHILQS